MGLIRKSLAVGTLGVVNGSSKKQRVARQTMQNTAAQTALLKQQLQAEKERAAAEEEYRYATDPTYRAYVDQKRAEAAEAERLRRQRLAERRRRQGVRLGQAIAIPALAATFMVIAVVVWLPQVGVARVRRSSATLWMKDRLQVSWHSWLRKS